MINEKSKKISNLDVFLKTHDLIELNQKISL